jgi:hypothetical protein
MGHRLSALDQSFAGHPQKHRHECVELTVMLRPENPAYFEEILRLA